MRELSEQTINAIKEMSSYSNANSDPWIWRFSAFFENGYGISVICGEGTYGGRNGLFEIAVLTRNGDKIELCYDTPITDGVIGHLTEAEVLEYAHKIKDLKEPIYVLQRDESTDC